MPYNPSNDFVGLWRAVSGGVEKAQMPGLDFLVAALGRAGILRVVTSATPPVTNQNSTAWFQPANPSFSAEGILFLWNGSTYVPATPELFFNGGWNTGGGGGDGGGSGGSDMVIISGTAPSNPATGQEWWDGTTMHVWDGAQWKVVGVTGTVGTTTNVFAIAEPTTTSIATSGWTIVPFSTTTPQVDTMNGWDPVTFKWKPNKAGVYSFNIRGWGGSTIAAAIALLKNDNGTFTGGTDNFLAIASFSAASAGSAWLTASAITVMNGTTDYVRMFASNPAGTISGVGGNPMFVAWQLP